MESVVPSPAPLKGREATAVDRIRSHRASSTPVRLKAADGGGVTIEVEHADKGVGTAMLMDAIGTKEVDFIDPYLLQMVNAVSKGGKVDESASVFMLAVVRGIDPRDQMEAMLAAQMGAVHVATMAFARKLNHVDNIPQQDSAERAFNKLARTFAMQMEALKRYRTGGQQTVVVQHVTVSDGGQAIVGGTVTAGGGRKGDTTP